MFSLVFLSLFVALTMLSKVLIEADRFKAFFRNAQRGG
jgi:hypothetical protein